jgi:ParB family chromosome partitioning protein
MSNELTFVPLNKLVRSSLNVRKTGADSIDDLAASIAVHGLLQNLTVTKKSATGKTKSKADTYEVVAGGRRLAALQSLAKQQKIPKDYAVPCKVVTDCAEELSLVENTIRQPMHPADQFEAFHRLVGTGLSVEDVAARFGLTSLFVAQRLKLANVSPTFIQLYRDGGMRLEQLEALAISNDHDAQERVWHAAHEWERTPSALRRALTVSTVDAADKRVLFVGLDSYLQRGGGLERDLFDAEHDGFLTDVNLLETLVIEKLQAEADKLKADGWSWVEVNRTEDRWRAVRTYQQLRPKSVSLSDKLQEEADRLIKERATLQSKEESDYSQDDEDRIEEINDRLEAIEATTHVFTPKQKSISGVMIGITFNGQLAADYGLTQERVSIDSDEGCEAPAKPAEPVDPEKLSGSLQEELTAQRTVAIRAELMARPDVALVAITHRLAGHFCYPSYQGVATAVMISPARFGLEADLPVTVGSKADEQLNAAAQTWAQRLPEKVDQLWDWLIEQPQHVILDLLAFVVAQTINAVQLPHQQSNEGHLRGANALSKALGLEMANWWAPTAENYFSRIKKEQIIAAITDASGKAAPERLKSLKKSDLAAEAESIVKGTRWLPPVLS